MNLKEAFHYQKFLDNLRQKALALLVQESVNTETIRTHIKHKVNADAEDIVETSEPYSEDFGANDLIDFATWLVGQKCALTEAINTAKRGIWFDVDAANASNIVRRQTANTLSSIANNKSYNKKIIGRGTDYKFNVEGNQVSYYYDIETISHPAFDQAAAKRLAVRMKSEADELSTKIEEAYINTEVDYVEPFSCHEEFNDVIVAFKKNIAKTAE